jgi:hypothetical protein
MIIPDIYLMNTTPPDESSVTRRIIRSEMEIEWLRSCLTLATMTGLKNLEVDLWKNTYEAVEENRLLKGLCTVKVSDGGKFVVRLPAVTGDPKPEAESMSIGGFRLEWREFGIEPVSHDFLPSPYSTGISEFLKLRTSPRTGIRCYRF